ncbi:MAG: tetratricopeptide repeat protein [Desulfobacteraceae bacterium]|nr:tetratricopeptide repeat protein [Desulfobacteraceae bacterium]
MIHKFTSKEIHFLKAESDEHPVQPPEIFFSDLLQTQTVQIKTLNDRLASTEIPGNDFICAIVQISEKAPERTKEKAKEIFEACFHSVLDKERGIWESLDDTAFAMVFWDYIKEENGSRLIGLLKEKISTALKTDILMGVATFPFHNFKKADILGNALKAIDHAAFFGSNHMIYFNAVSLNISGDRLYQLKHYDKAIQEYKKGLENDPRNINLINSLGVCYGVIGKIEQAQKEFTKAIAMNPVDVMVIYNIGLIHRINDDEDRAIIYLKKAHGIDQNVFEIELLLGHLLFKQKQWTRALPHLEAAGRLNPDAARAFRMKGEIFLDKLDKKDPRKAWAQFNKAVKLNPSDAVSLSGYAHSMALQKKNLKIALSFANKSVTLEPDNPLFCKRLKQIQKIYDQTVQEDTTKSA